MKVLMAIVAVLALSSTADAGIFRHRPIFRGFEGPIARATFRPQPRFSRTPMVWRGDWVPAYMVR
jgi:hypothetical protein